MRADYSICLIAMNTTSTFSDLFRYMGKSSVCYRENYGYAYQLLPTEPHYTPFLNFVKAQELSWVFQNVTAVLHLHCMNHWETQVSFAPLHLYYQVIDTPERQVSCWTRPYYSNCYEPYIEPNAIWGEGQPKLEHGQRVYLNKSDDYKWYTAADNEIEINPVCRLGMLSWNRTSTIKPNTKLDFQKQNRFFHSIWTVLWNLVTNQLIAPVERSVPRIKIWMSAWSSKSSPREKKICSKLTKISLLLQALRLSLPTFYT